MNNQEIIDNAPEGATHIDGEYDFCKDGSYFGYSSKRWIPSEFIVGSRSLADIKRIAELENQWISVEDKLPDELQSVLSFASYDGVFQSNYRAGNFKKTLVVWEHLNVTHWMPLPSPPKEQY